MGTIEGHVLESTIGIFGGSYQLANIHNLWTPMQQINTQLEAGIIALLIKQMEKENAYRCS